MVFPSGTTQLVYPAGLTPSKPPRHMGPHGPFSLCTCVLPSPSCRKAWGAGSFRGEAGHHPGAQRSLEPCTLDAPALSQGTAVWQAGSLWLGSGTRMQAMGLESLGANAKSLTVGRIPNPSVPPLLHL